MRITIFANTVHTNTLTGGDRIFAECAKRWIASSHAVTVITNEVGVAYCTGLGVRARSILEWKASWIDRCGVYIAMFVKACISILRAVPYASHITDIAFASSFFVPDLVPAFFLKLTNKNATFAAACYLYSTQPWGRDYSGGRLKGFFFYLNEQIAFFLLKHWDGLVITASEFDRNKFIKSQGFPSDKVLAFRGGVDTTFFQTMPKQDIIYDAIFVGRFHPQKSIGELIEIWGGVVASDPSCTLALVGAGPLELDLKKLIAEKNLTRNILFLGVVDGVNKSKILKSSRIFVSASRFDSGNIALDEALGCGVPGVVYDLPRLYYPQGVIKVPVGDKKAFMREIHELLTNSLKRKKLSEEAIVFSLSLDWEEKAKELLGFLKNSHQGDVRESKE